METFLQKTNYSLVSLVSNLRFGLSADLVDGERLYTSNSVSHFTTPNGKSCPREKLFGY
jgi:hypothetical protein